MEQQIRTVDDVLSFFNNFLEEFGVRAYRAEMLDDGFCWVGFDEVVKDQLRDALAVFNPLDLVELKGTLIPSCLVSKQGFRIAGLATRPKRLFKVDDKHIGLYCRNNEALFKCIFPIKEGNGQ